MTFILLAKCLSAIKKKKTKCKILLLLSEIKQKWDKGENICPEWRFKCFIQLPDTSFCLRSNSLLQRGAFYSIPSCLSLIATLNLSSRRESSLIRSVMALVKASWGL